MSRAQAYGVACLAYTLFDSLVDGHFAVQDRVRDRVESIEGAILAGAEGAATDLFRLRKELLRVPRLIAPTSHVLARVLRRERSIPDGLRPYFTDVQDRARHVLAELDTCRDLLGAALDVNVFHAFNRLGLIMKRLTAVTVIIMVPNFVASIYGMNFNHLVPSSRLAVQLPGRCRPAGVHGRVGLHPLPSSRLALRTAPVPDGAISATPA